jgi:hypothetical protein
MGMKESKQPPDPEQEERRLRYHNTWPQSTSQSHSNINSIVLAPKETQTIGTHQKIHKQDHTAIAICFSTKLHNPLWKLEKKTASSTNGVGKTAHLKVKQDPSLTLYKKPTQNESKTAM